MASKKRRNKVRAKRRGKSKRVLGCPCKGGCCRAAGSTCACKCHGRNHGAVRRLPPPPPRPAGSPKLNVHRFEGRPLGISYERGGQRYHHRIESAQMYYPADGSAMLILKGVQVNKFLEG